MQKLLILITILAVLTGCDNKELNDANKKNKALASKLAKANETIRIYNMTPETIEGKRQTVLKLDAQVRNGHKTLGMLKHDTNWVKYINSGKRPMYILTLKFKKKRVNPFDVGGAIKDEMNSFEFDVPVDKRFYDKQRVGSTVADNFKTASFFFSGKMQSLGITVSNKRMVK
jgi:hypothetical protein